MSFTPYYVGCSFYLPAFRLLVCSVITDWTWLCNFSMCSFTFYYFNSDRRNRMRPVGRLISGCWCSELMFLSMRPSKHLRNCWQRSGFSFSFFSLCVSILNQKVSQPQLYFRIIYVFSVCCCFSRLHFQSSHSFHPLSFLTCSPTLRLVFLFVEASCAHSAWLSAGSFCLFWTVDSDSPDFDFLPAPFGKACFWLMLHSKLFLHDAFDQF